MIIGFTCALAIAGLPASGLGGQRNSADPDSISMLNEIKAQTLARSKAFSYVLQLSDSFGPRLTGTPQTALACRWALQTMKHSGLQNVHLEPFRMSHGWQRGHATAKLLSPFSLQLNISSYGWVGSTKPGGVDADVAVVNSDLFADEVKQHARLWKDKVLYLAPLGPKHLNPIRVFSQLPTLLAAATKAGAVAVIYSTDRPGPMLTHTGPGAFRDSFFPMPVVDIAPEHKQLIQRLLFSRKRVRLHIDVQNSVTQGSVLSENVVGEIPGYDTPNECVILSAHLDSWDLGTGSVDDGFGVAAVLAAADSIVAQHIRPKRTVRFVLFTGEEEGLLGSIAYVKAHEAEAKNIVCAFALDWGSGPIVKLPLAGRDEMAPAFEKFVQLMDDFGPVEITTGAGSYLTFTDAFSFTLGGIPGIAPLQNSPDYITVGHSAEDTLDKVDPKFLVQDAAFLACLGFWAANYPTRLAPHWSLQQTQNALIRDQKQTLLELCNLWPTKR